MQFGEQRANPTVRLLAADELDPAGLDVLDSAAKAVEPGRVELVVLSIDTLIAVEAQKADVDHCGAIIGWERK